ncbi:hypothetical protein MYX78_07920 [Acidobacteria bacterium AH-259-G07]|nr:hypothetical protein [Acidobacteria bacterium AH-259-G07]
MSTIEKVEARRNAILEELRSIRSLRHGTINEQYLKGHVQGKEEPVRRGPYYVFSRHEGGKTVSRRLSSGAELKEARKEVAEHKRFVALCKEFEELTQKLGELERQADEQEPKKKRRRWRSSKIRK